MKALGIIIAFTLLAASSARAVDFDKASRGNTLVCFDSKGFSSYVRHHGGIIPASFIPHVKSIEAWDLVIAKNVQQAHVVEIGEKETLLEYINRLLTRASVLAPQVGWLFLKMDKTLSLTQVISHSYGISYGEGVQDFLSDDAGYDHDLCVTAVMTSHYYESDKDGVVLSSHINVDRRLFNHPAHSRTSQGAAMLHELASIVAELYTIAPSRTNVDGIVSLMLLGGTKITAFDYVVNLIRYGLLDNSAAFCYPGAQAYRLTNEGFEAVNAAEMLVTEQTRVNYRIAKQALEPFHAECAGQNLLSCLRAIRELEAKGTPGLESLADIKLQLEQAEKMLREADFMAIDIYYDKQIRPAFENMPYGTADQRLAAGQRLRETLKRAVEERFKKYGMLTPQPDFPLGLADNEDIARALGHIVDGLFNLRVNPVEMFDEQHKLQ
jgi:hypothetical protein